MINPAIIINKQVIPTSELILNDDGSVYHIKLLPEHIADHVIVVGDQHRVERISRHFQTIEYKIQNREFVTHTGLYNGERITVLSTGIGADNIDIVVNELDAAVNIDLKKRVIKEDLRALNIIRIGTSGSLQEDLPVDAYLVSEFGMGLDGVMHFYDGFFTEEETDMAKSYNQHANWGAAINQPYFVKGSTELVDLLKPEAQTGITATAIGFYGPQGRQLRLKPSIPNINETLGSFSHNGKRITNFEMETSALYGLGRTLGHNCCTVCAIIANRIRREYSADYKKTVDELIEYVLGKLTG